MPRTTKVTILLTVVALATCGDALPTEVLGDCEDNPRQAVLGLVNDIRVASGLDPLALDVRLASSAQGHSVDMSTGNFLSHTGSDGSSPGDRMTAAGYPWRSRIRFIRRRATFPLCFWNG